MTKKKRMNSKFKGLVFLLLRLFFVFMIFIVFSIYGCGEVTTPTKHCTDPDYPLWCPDHRWCCPSGFPISCGGLCYKTREDAVRNCSASIDTCEPEK